MHETADIPARRNFFSAFGGGALIGSLGGLIGLGGAEFRLPLLIGVFRFAALEAVILNKAMSLVVVATALPSARGLFPSRKSPLIGPLWSICWREVLQGHGSGQDGQHA